MSAKMITKENTTIFEEIVSDKIFVCAQGNKHSCAVVCKVEELNSSVLDDLVQNVDAHIFKIIGKKGDYAQIEKSLGIFCDDVKFVQREHDFTVFFDPKSSQLRVKKEDPSQLIEEIQKVVKVLVVDDSTTICNLLKKIMGLSPLIEVVGSVNNPLEAAEAIERLRPDVVTLDIHMPNLNGVELLKQIYPKYKIPCIMISSISISEGPLVLDALDAGAVDYIQKPDMSNFANIAAEINKKIISASKVKHVEKSRNIKVSAGSQYNTDNNLIVLGASTGGTKALKEVLDHLPDEIPPILIVQHIPAEFSRAFAERLDASTKFIVKEAENGDLLKSNLVLIAPGGKQMKFVEINGVAKVEINDDAPVNRFQPSVDYLFNSLADSNCQKNIVAAIFTGMGKDGALGMKALKQNKNAQTIAQDEKSSVVFGMPKEAIKLGCVDNIVSLDEAATEIVRACGRLPLKNAQ